MKLINPSNITVKLVYELYIYFVDKANKGYGTCIGFDEDRWGIYHKYILNSYQTINTPSFDDFKTCTDLKNMYIDLIKIKIKYNL